MQRLRVDRSERGVTLVELLVTMVLLSVVTGSLILGVMAIYRGTRYTNQDSDTLGALRTTLDRFEKEVRHARLIFTGSDEKHVYVWVDGDGDYRQDLSEKIHWEIAQIGASDRAQFVRYTDADPTERSLSQDLIFDEDETNFAYNNNAGDPLEESTSIVILLTALGEGNLSEKRSVTTEVRLRNAEL